MAEQVKIGRLIEGTAERDAIHVAIAPVTADEKLVPGQRIGFVSGSGDRVEAKIGAALAHEVIGIVDPFIPTLVEPEERFYMLLLPNTITSLRHEWIHPAFASNAAEKIAAAKGEIQKQADDAGLDYDEMMAAAERHLKYKDYLCEGGRWDGHYLDPSFWDHYETVTGVKVGDNERGSFFYCSC